MQFNDLGLIPYPLDNRDSLDVCSMGKHVYGLKRANPVTASRDGAKVHGKRFGVARYVDGDGGPNPPEQFSYYGVRTTLPRRIEDDDVRVAYRWQRGFNSPRHEATSSAGCGIEEQRSLAVCDGEPVLFNGDHFTARVCERNREQSAACIKVENAPRSLHGFADEADENFGGKDVGLEE